MLLWVSIGNPILMAPFLEWEATSGPVSHKCLVLGSLQALHKALLNFQFHQIR